MSFLLLCSFQRAFCFDIFRLASLLLGNARPRRWLRVPRLSFAAPRHTKNLFAKTRHGSYIPCQVVRYSLKTNQCRTAYAAKCLDFEICSEVSLFSCLLRKEVIQPHLPIRLPCYDFTPIIDFTLDGWLPKVTPPALGTSDFRGVTGGVYKARERIHRSMLTCDY